MVSIGASLSGSVLRMKFISINRPTHSWAKINVHPKFNVQMFNAPVSFYTHKIPVF